MTGVPIDHAPGGRPARVPFRSSIHAQLVGLIAIVIAGVVGFLTWYFPSREISTLQATQQTRVASYGAVLSSQARSAVAFSDRETAREVLSPLASDPNVASCVLFDEAGHTLYEHGTPSPWVERARAGVQAQRLVQVRDRAAVVVPVQSLEGPRGTLVIELSNERLLAHQRSVIATAILIGGLVLVLGVIAASLIARSVIRRLGTWGRSRVRSPRTPRTHAIELGRPDELGVFAFALNRMIGKLQAKQASLSGTVAELTLAEEALATANRDLERRVEQRTAELRVEMDRRTQVEIELRHAQKLESVGRLAAGVAHEINTHPVRQRQRAVRPRRDHGAVRCGRGAAHRRRPGARARSG